MGIKMIKFILSVGVICVGLLILWGIPYYTIKTCFSNTMGRRLKTVTKYMSVSIFLIYTLILLDIMMAIIWWILFILKMIFSL